jgi:hypothetical protein
MQIKYVGLKDFEDAFSRESGVTWGPGVEHDIADEDLAARMLKHPDVFAVADDSVKELEEQGAPAQDTPEDQPQKPQFVMQTEEGALVLDFLDKDTLKQLAKEADISVGNSGPDKIRQKLAEAFPVKD